jgi:hypothetical protein
MFKDFNCHLSLGKLLHLIAVPIKFKQVIVVHR